MPETDLNKGHSGGKTPASFSPKGEMNIMMVQNSFVGIGRVTRDPVILENKDGSRKVKFTLAIQDSFKSDAGRTGEKKRATQFIPMEAFIRKEDVEAGKLGVWPHVHEGDRIACGGHMKSEQYEKNGEMIYTTKLVVDSVSLEENRSATEARAAKKQANTEAAPAPAAAENEPLPFN